MNGIIDSDYESVGRLVNIAIRNNKSIQDIVRRLELAIAGKYQVQSYEVSQCSRSRHLVLTFELSRKSTMSCSGGCSLSEDQGLHIRWQKH